MAVTREELYPDRGGVVIDFPVRLAGSRPPPLPRGAGGGAARRRTLRVTSRGRALLAGLAGALAVVCLFAAVGSGGPAVLSRPGAPRAVVVGPGETLWDLARRHAGRGVDTRAYVDAVLALNEVEGAPGAAELVRLPPRQDREQKVPGSP